MGHDPDPSGSTRRGGRAPGLGALARCAGGILGPVAFTAAWAVLGRRKAGYSPVHDPISRLAAVGAETRGAMTVAFLVRTVGVGAYSRELAAVAPAAGRSAGVNAVANLAVAAFPLDWRYGDGAHAVAAGLSYLSLAAIPVADRRTTGAADRSSRALSVATAVLTAAGLTASVVSERRQGLHQRIGLTAGNAWIAGRALRSLMTAVRAHDRSR